MNPSFGQSVSSESLKNLGIPEFHSEIKNDKVALIIKSQNSKNEDEIVVWYSEKSFVSNLMNGILAKKATVQTRVIAEEPL